MGELVVRALGGVHTLFGLGLAGAAASAVDQGPETALGWIGVAVGAALVIVMVVAGLRLSLGQPVRPAPATIVIVATLGAGLIGAFLVAASAN